MWEHADAGVGGPTSDPIAPVWSSSPTRRRSGFRSCSTNAAENVSLPGAGGGWTRGPVVDDQGATLSRSVAPVSENHLDRVHVCDLAQRPALDPGGDR